MKRTLVTLGVTGLLTVLCSVALAQGRYTPPGGGTSPPQSSPDPTGLTLIVSGTAAAVGYVLRRKRDAS